MILSTYIAGGALVISAAGFLVGLFRTARIQGADRQRIRNLETALAKQASSESVRAMGGRIAELEDDVKQVVAAVAEVSVVKEKVMGLDRLVTTQLDEIKHSLRRMEERSFDPAPPATRRRATTT